MLVRPFGKARCLECRLLTWKVRNQTEMKSPRRKLAMLLVLLCGGAIVNIAVAWGINVLSNPFSARYLFGEQISKDSTTWRICLWTRIGSTYFLSQHRWVPTTRSGIIGIDPTSLLPRWFDASQLSLNPKFETTLVGGAGFPFVCLYSNLDLDSSFTVRNSRTSIQLSTTISPWPAIVIPRNLPLGIIPSAFAIDTFFYAGIMWLLFAAPGFVRRCVRGGRINRGLCPSCAYPVGENEVCTECGAPKQTKK